jgi:hypothetical protein
MSCHHHSALPLCECAMKSGNHGMEYGLASPFPPGSASMILSIELPNATRIGKFHMSAGNLSSGHLADPFQPPRS